MTLQTSIDGDDILHISTVHVVRKFLSTFEPERIIEKGQGYIVGLFYEHLIQHYGSGPEVLHFVMTTTVMRDLQRLVASRKKLIR